MLNLPPKTVGADQFVLFQGIHERMSPGVEKAEGGEWADAEEDLVCNLDREVEVA